MTADSCVNCFDLIEIFNKYGQRVSDKCAKCGESIKYVEPTINEKLAALEKCLNAEVPSGLSCPTSRNPLSNDLGLSAINNIIRKVYASNRCYYFPTGHFTVGKYEKDTLKNKLLFIGKDPIDHAKTLGRLFDRIGKPLFMTACYENGKQMHKFYTEEMICKLIPFFANKNIFTEDLKLFHDSVKQLEHYNLIPNVLGGIYSLELLLVKYEANLIIWANECDLAVKPTNRAND